MPRTISQFLAILAITSVPLLKVSAECPCATINGPSVLPSPTVVNVRQLGAAGDGIKDDTPALQKALEGGHRTVVIPAGTYIVSATLKIDSQTTIKADPRAIVRLADHAGRNVNVFVLANRDTANGNSDISVEGGIWDGNNEHNARGGWGDPNAYTGAAINFVHVRRLALHKVTVRNPDAYSIRLCVVEDFVLEDISFEHTVIRKNQDGIHVGGFCKQGVIRNVCVLTPHTTNDDMVALNADDVLKYPTNLGMKCGPIRDITVDNLHADEVWTFVRLLSWKEPIENITISNVSGGCRVHAINLIQTASKPGCGNIRNVTLRNFNVHKEADSANPRFSGAVMIPIQSAAGGLRIENFHRDPADKLPGPTFTLDNGQQNHVRLVGLNSVQVAGLCKLSPTLTPAMFHVGTIDREGEILDADIVGKVILPKGGFTLLELKSKPATPPAAPATAGQNDPHTKQP